MAHIPKPFSRPTVEINHTGRRWVQTLPGSLSERDIVEDRGMVIGKTLSDGLVFISFYSGDLIGYVPTHVLRAFTLGESVGISK